MKRILVSVMVASLAVAVIAGSSGGASSFNELDITFVMQKIENDFALAVRIAGLVATSASTGLLMNGTQVDLAIQRKLLYNSIEFARPSVASANPTQQLIFGPAIGWNHSENACEFYMYHNHNSSWFTKLNSGPTWLEGVGRNPTMASTATGARPKGESDVCDNLTGADAKYASSFGSTTGLDGQGCMRFFTVDEVGKPEDLMFYFPYSPW